MKKKFQELTHLCNLLKTEIQKQNLDGKIEGVDITLFDVCDHLKQKIQECEQAVSDNSSDNDKDEDGHDIEEVIDMLKAINKPEQPQEQPKEGYDGYLHTMMKAQGIIE